MPGPRRRCGPASGERIRTAGPRGRARPDRHARAGRDVRANPRSGRHHWWVRSPGPLPARGGRGGPLSIRVLVADDQALVRTGFRMILEAQPDVAVVAEAADGAEAVAQAE